MERGRGLKCSSKAGALACSTPSLKLYLSYGQNFLQTSRRRAATNATLESFVIPRGQDLLSPEAEKVSCITFSRSISRWALSQICDCGPRASSCTCYVDLSDPSIPNDNYLDANATRPLFVNSSLPGDMLRGTSAVTWWSPAKFGGSRQYGSRLSYFPVFLRASNALTSSSVIVMSCWSA
jgi:hypothetical protein